VAAAGLCPFLGMEVEIKVLSFAEDQRGALLGELVLQLTARARALHLRPLPYRAYAQRRQTMGFESPDLDESLGALITSPRHEFERTGKAT
jgi:hypothetical protein